MNSKTERIEILEDQINYFRKIEIQFKDLILMNLAFELALLRLKELKQSLEEKK